MSLFDAQENYVAGIPLSKYTAAITNAVVSAPSLAGVWVIAELSDVRTSGGHCYMELIEKNEAGQTVAKLRANIWRSTFLQLRQKFFNATQRDITTGIKALVKGSATHHSLYGLSFNITDIDPSYTIGDLERLRREIFIRLQKEGIVNNNKSLEFPLGPQRIAVISAEGAAGYGDFMNQITSNAEGFVFYTRLFPCVMQGDKVSESIRKALLIIESTAELWDCIAIVRGGGATTDLNGFDDYELAKAVATCALPVVVGIGHERDRNILDEIAHTSLKTPTAVAGFFIDSLRNAYEQMLFSADKIRTYSGELIRGEERKISSLHSLLPQLAIRKLEDAKAKLNSISSQMPLITRARLGNESARLRSFNQFLSNITFSRLEKEHIKIQNLIQNLRNLTDNRINRESQMITAKESLIKALDPKNILLRGYSITRVNGKAVKSSLDLKNGDILTTILPDGEIESKVIK